MRLRTCGAGSRPSASARAAPDVSRADSTGGLTAAEIDQIYTAMLGAEGGGEPWLLLAVSGGADSMALMHIAAEGLARLGRGRCVVATVDHGLRTESAEEALFVAEEARRVGLEHRTLVWTGPKPDAGIQEAARLARYRLLGGVYCSEPAAFKRLVTAHTQDDQAETVLMRLARGSGVDGLSSIPARGTLMLDGGDGGEPKPVEVVRPLLGVAKARLIATLRERGLAWCEDPSNANRDYERVRLREVMPALAAIGLTPEALARSAGRLARSRLALEEVTGASLRDPRLIRVRPLGFVDLDRAIWAPGPDELAFDVQVRVLAAAVRMAGGVERPVSLQSVEALAETLRAARCEGRMQAVTLGRTRIASLKHCVRIAREAGRALPAPLRIEPGQTVIWDNRFEVELEGGAPRGFELRAIGGEGIRQLVANGVRVRGVARHLLLALPAFWDGDRLVSCPLANGEERRWRSARGLDPEGVPNDVGRFCLRCPTGAALAALNGKFTL